MNRHPAQGSDRQSYNSDGLFCFMDIVAKEAEGYAKDHTTPMSELL